jgi:hypothetical protein
MSFGSPSNPIEARREAEAIAWVAIQHETAKLLLSGAEKLIEDSGLVPLSELRASARGVTRVARQLLVGLLDVPRLVERPVAQRLLYIVDAYAAATAIALQPMRPTPDALEWLRESAAQVVALFPQPQP